MNTKDRHTEHSEDRERFPLPDGYFETLEGRIRARRDQGNTSTFGRRIGMISTVLAAAAMAVFLLNRDNVRSVTVPDPALMSEAAQQMDEHWNSTGIIQLAEDSTERTEIATLDQVQAIAEEVNNLELVDHLYTPETKDPLDGVSPDEIEEYLIDHLITYNDL